MRKCENAVWPGEIFGVSVGLEILMFDEIYIYTCANEKLSL